MREVIDGEGRAWSVEIASHGRTSGYLNPKVHRPIIQFSCRTAPLPRRYVSLPSGHHALDSLGDDELKRLWQKAKTH